MAEQIQTGQPTIPDYVEVGNVGLQQWGGGVYEEFLPHLQWPQAAGVFREMSENDPTIGAVLYMSKQLIRKAGWGVDAASDKPIDKEAAEFLKSCMDDMSMSWANTISEILSVLTYGWSYHEIVYKVRRGPDSLNPKFKSKYNDGRIGWRKLPIRSQHTLFEWEFGEDGDVTGMWQQSPPHYRRCYIPLNKALLFRTEVTRNNPEGRSLLRSAYRPWYFKKRIEEIEGIGIERDLAGLPLLQPPENIDIWDPDNEMARKTRTVAENIVRNVRRDKSEGLVIPYGWEFKLLSTGGTRQFDTNAIINRYDNRIAITMLADIVMMGGDKVGSFALGEVKKSLLAASLESQIQNIADVFNKYAVPQLFKMNNFAGITDYPKIKPGEVEIPDIKDLAFLLRASGLDITKDIKLMNLVRKLISVDPFTEEEFKKFQEEAQKQKDAEFQKQSELKQTEANNPQEKAKVGAVDNELKAEGNQ